MIRRTSLAWNDPKSICLANPPSGEILVVGPGWGVKGLGVQNVDVSDKEAVFIVGMVVICGVFRSMPLTTGVSPSKEE